MDNEVESLSLLYIIILLVTSSMYYLKKNINKIFCFFFERRAILIGGKYNSTMREFKRGRSTIGISHSLRVY